jgi:hypothetical protein
VSSPLAVSRWLAACVMRHPGSTGMFHTCGELHCIRCGRQHSSAFSSSRSDLVQAGPVHSGHRKYTNPSSLKCSKANKIQVETKESHKRIIGEACRQHRHGPRHPSPPTSPTPQHRNSYITSRVSSGCWLCKRPCVVGLGLSCWGSAPTGTQHSRGKKYLYTSI